MDSKEALVVFEGAKIRRIWHDEQWFFSVVDIIQVLTDSSSPRQYWGVLKSRETQLLTICLQLKLPSSDGKYYNTDCVNTENAFRLIQSIPSKKAEPFKRWLAKVGYERVQEIENPELAQERMKQLYDQNPFYQEEDTMHLYQQRLAKSITSSKIFIMFSCDICFTTASDANYL